MENMKEETAGMDYEILKNNNQFEQEKEQKFVNLIIEIIVSSTLREYYEKSDQVSEV